MRIGEVFDRIYDEEVGWRPVTGTIKPVHVANGMFRAITRQRHDIARIISFIVWWRKKTEKLPHEERSFEKLVTEQPEGPFACFREDPRRFDRARDFVRAILGADGAVSPDAGYSSLTLTCREMISSDPNDHGLDRETGEDIFGQPAAVVPPRTLHLKIVALSLALTHRPSLPRRGRRRVARRSFARGAAPETRSLAPVVPGRRSRTPGRRRHRPGPQW
jgi:hypothetical protein